MLPETVPHISIVNASVHNKLIVVLHSVHISQFHLLSTNATSNEDIINQDVHVGFTVFTLPYELDHCKGRSITLSQCHRTMKI